MKKLVHLWFRFLDGRKLRKAIVEAEKLHRTQRKRFYVICDDQGEISIVTKEWFKMLRRDGYIHESMFVRDLREQCSYFTPYPNGNDAITKQLAREKREQYLEHMLKIRASRSAGDM